MQKITGDVFGRRRSERARGGQGGGGGGGRGALTLSLGCSGSPVLSEHVPLLPAFLPRRRTVCPR